MKKLLFFLTLLFVIQASAQQKFKAAVSVGGPSLNRGGEFDYVIYGNGMNNATTRQLLFDLQYDRNNFEIVSVLSLIHI